VHSHMVAGAQCASEAQGVYFRTAAIVIDRTGWHRVELIISNGRAAFDRDAVEFVQFLFASCGGEAVADLP
jgi:hypothetical protein